MMTEMMEWNERAAGGHKQSSLYYIYNKYKKKSKDILHLFLMLSY